MMKSLIIAISLSIVSFVTSAQVLEIQVPEQSAVLDLTFKRVQRVIIKKTTEGYLLVQDFYESGQRLTEPFLIKNQKQLTNYDYNQLDIEGYFSLWYANGQKWEEGYYVKGKKQGQWRSWLTNGQDVVNYQYQAGKLLAVK